MQSVKKIMFVAIISVVLSLSGQAFGLEADRDVNGDLTGTHGGQIHWPDAKDVSNELMALEADRDSFGNLTGTHGGQINWG